MSLDLTKPLALNDGTPVELVRYFPEEKRVVVRVPKDHRLYDGYSAVRDFQHDGTRASHLKYSDYYLVNVEPDLPTEAEWKKLFIYHTTSEALAELKRRNLIKPKVDPVIALAREIARMDPNNIDAIADKIRAFSP